jgi:hypothetical protein
VPEDVGAHAIADVHEHAGEQSRDVCAQAINDQAVREVVRGDVEVTDRPPGSSGGQEATSLKGILLLLTHFTRSSVAV